MTTYKLGDAMVVVNRGRARVLAEIYSVQTLDQIGVIVDIKYDINHDQAHDVYYLDFPQLDHDGPFPFRAEHIEHVYVFDENGYPSPPLIHG